MACAAMILKIMHSITFNKQTLPPSGILLPTYISLLLCGDRTEQTVPAPTVTMWVLSLMMAGRSEDWNSQPHKVTTVSPPAGTLLGKNCSGMCDQTEMQSASCWPRTASELHTRVSWQTLQLQADWPRWWRARTSFGSSARHTPAASSTFPNTSRSSWRREPSGTWSRSWNGHILVLQWGPWTSAPQRGKK